MHFELHFLQRSEEPCLFDAWVVKYLLIILILIFVWFPLRFERRWLWQLWQEPTIQNIWCVCIAVQICFMYWYFQEWPNQYRYRYFSITKYALCVQYRSVSFGSYIWFDKSCKRTIYFVWILVSTTLGFDSQGKDNLGNTN